MAVKKKPAAKSGKSTKKKAASKPKKGRAKLSPQAATEVRKLLKKVRDIAKADKGGKLFQSQLF